MRWFSFLNAFVFLVIPFHSSFYLQGGPCVSCIYRYPFWAIRLVLEEICGSLVLLSCAGEVWEYLAFR